MTSINDTVPEWTVQRIQGYIDGKIQESVSLDYKDSRALGRDDPEKRELAKDVSAMANSEGGTLIYGVREKGHFPTTIDDGIDPAKINREFIENVLTSTIHPRINGLLIHPVPLLSGNTLYVIEIPKTLEGGPHQSADKKYYKRFNFKAEPMEDYEIRDVMRRALGPNLVCQVEIPEFDDDPTSENYKTFTLNISVTNESDTVALYAHIQLFVDSRLEIVSGGDFQVGASDVIHSSGDLRVKIRPMNLPWGIPGKLPIWRGINFLASDKPIRLRLKEGDEVGYMFWVRLTSPQMEIKSSAFALLPTETDIKQRVHRVEIAQFDPINGIKI